MTPKFSFSSIYLADGKPAILAATHFNLAGIRYEQDYPVLVSDWKDGEALAAALRISLGKSCFKERNLRDDKRSEWPAYRASRCSSADEFERIYLHVSVWARDTAEWPLVEITAQPPGEYEISLHVSLRLSPQEDEETVESLVRLFRVCVNWHERLES